MAEYSSIEWTGATWNPITGCSVVSPGCTNCYAMKLAGTRLKHHASRTGLTIETRSGPVWNGRVRLNEQWMDQPFRWRRPREIFAGAHTDLFHDAVPLAWLDRVFATIAATPWHTYQVLTKRPERMLAYFTDERLERLAARLDAKVAHPTGELPLGALVDAAVLSKPLPNLWLGISAEDQQRFDERVGHLRRTPAAIRFISFEPLLGPIRAKAGLMGFGLGTPADCTCGHGHGFDRCPNYGAVSPRCHRCNCTAFTRASGTGGIHLAIVGGENGPRPTHPAWVRQLREDCAATGTGFFFKQWGSWVAEDQAPADTVWFEEGTPRHTFDDGQEVWKVGKRWSGRLLDSVEHNYLPGVAHG